MSELSVVEAENARVWDGLECDGPVTLWMTNGREGDNPSTPLNCKLGRHDLKAEFGVDLCNNSHSRGCLYTLDNFRVGRVSSPGEVLPFLPLRPREWCVRTFSFALEEAAPPDEYTFVRSQLEVTFRVVGVYTSPFGELSAVTAQDSWLFRRPDFTVERRVLVTVPRNFDRDAVLRHRVL